MAGILTAAGKHLIAEMIFNLDTTDREATMKMGLFTNSSGLSAASVLGDITVPTGTGYAAATLADADWTVTLGVATHVKKTFTAGAGGWTGAIYGYYIYSVAAGGTPRLMFYEIDTNQLAPYTLVENDSYEVTSTVTVS